MTTRRDFFIRFAGALVALKAAPDALMFSGQNVRAAAGVDGVIDSSIPIGTRAVSRSGCQYRYVRASEDLIVGNMCAGPYDSVSNVVNLTHDNLSSLVGVVPFPMRAGDCGWVQTTGPTTTTARFADYLPQGAS